MEFNFIQLMMSKKLSQLHPKPNSGRAATWLRDVCFHTHLSYCTRHTQSSWETPPVAVYITAWVSSNLHSIHASTVWSQIYHEESAKLFSRLLRTQCLHDLYPDFGLLTNLLFV